MTQKYENEICSVCYAKLFEDDDVVFCPICGAPYHRACYQRSNRCKYEEYHGTEKQWDKQHVRDHESKTSEPTDESTQFNEKTTCPNCGTVSANNTLFCPNCGTPFGKNRADGYANFSSGYARPYQPIFSDPLGGVDASETIDEVSVTDLAAFVGPSSNIYLPRFSKIEKNKKRGLVWNWSAFLIPQYYFLFRKCIGAGIFALTMQLITALLQFPLMMAIESYNTYAEISSAITSGDISQRVLLLFLCAGAVSLLSRIFFGLFANTIYKNHCVYAVKNIKKESEPDLIQETIAKKGGIAFWPVIIGTVAIDIVYSLISWYIFNFI